VTFAEAEVARLPGRDPAAPIPDWTGSLISQIRPTFLNEENQDGFPIHNAGNDGEVKREEKMKMRVRKQEGRTGQ